MSALVQRVRASGTCPPSLLNDALLANDDTFGSDLLSILDGTGFCLRSDDDTARIFLSFLPIVANINGIPENIDPALRSKALECRRSILLAIVRGTHADSTSLASIVSGGFLTEVKRWLDDTLARGSVDFLLHLLSSIARLPVCKATIKDSGLGKAVGAIERHRICKGTPNEAAIKERVQQIKDSWQARVKAQKIQESTTDGTGLKRSLPDSTSVSASASKKAKPSAPTEEVKKVSTFSSLLKKVTASPPAVANGMKDTGSSGTTKTISNVPAVATSGSDTNGTVNKKEKKPARRVKWADHFGGKIYTTQDDESEEVETPQQLDATVSWSDRKKRDRLREKELLSKAKKSKLMDDGDDDALDIIQAVKASIPWEIPLMLPDRSDVTKPLLESLEVAVQNARMNTVALAKYANDADVPESPFPLSESELQLEITSQSSAVVAVIPFFVPQVTPAPAPVTVPTFTETAAQPYAPTSTYSSALQFDTAATLEYVQSLGLPLFLVGQSRNALQTLAGSPSLLSTLIDANGMYDQPRFMNLVQTLSASAGGMQSLQAPSTAIYQPPISSYPIATNPYEQANVYHPPVKKAIDKPVEYNLHVSGFGPSTTEAEVIACFSPYVRINEVIMKGTVAFVNTTDPNGAARSKDILAGTLIGGMPVKITQATRKSKEANSSAHSYTNSHAAARPNSLSSYGNNAVTPVSLSAGPNIPNILPPFVPGSSLPPGMPNVDAVRDDRGNGSTKNLFIAGYGPSTTEQQLRDLVSQYVCVVGVILKGTFSFVNTTDRESAVYAREMLGGTMLNGGVVRINFAKETGRLGTSFDLTYGTNTGPNATRNAPNDHNEHNAHNVRHPQPSMSYYGRSGY